MSVLCEAIRTRSLVEFQYGGLRRVVAPYAHGRSTRGVEVLRAIQVGGGSRKGGYGFGKLWVMDRIVGPRMTGEHFEPDDPQYNPDDKALSEIHCRI
jgi:hypothetical protein